MRHFLTSSSILVVTLAYPLVPLFATDWPPKEDNRVVCLDLRSGKLLWEYQPKQLSEASFELYKAGLVVDQFIDEKIFYLDPEKGTPIKSIPRDRSQLLAESWASYMPANPLDNGWQLVDFRQGVTKVLRFRDPMKKAIVWTIETGRSPELLCSWKSFVFYAFGFPGGDAVLYAYRAGEKKAAWTFDANTIVRDRTRPLRQLATQALDDTLYVQAEEHIFALHPESGKLLWRRNVARDLGLRFAPDLFVGGLDTAAFAKSKDILVKQIHPCYSIRETCYRPGSQDGEIPLAP